MKSHLDGSLYLLRFLQVRKEILSILEGRIPNNRGRGRGNVTILLKLHVPEKFPKKHLSLKELSESIDVQEYEIEESIRREARNRRRGL